MTLSNIIMGFPCLSSTKRSLQINWETALQMWHFHSQIATLQMFTMDTVLCFRTWHLSSLHSSSTIYKCRFDNLNSDSKYSQRNLTFFSLDGIFFIKTGIYNLIIANSHITRYARIVFLSGKETFLFYVYNTYFSWNYWSLYINNNWVSYKPVDILSGIAQK